MTTSNSDGFTALPRPIPTPGRQKIAARAATGLFAAIMTLSGTLCLVGPSRLMGALLALGYPLYFLRLLGIAKLLGVAAILLPRRPRLREWAYAGFTFDLIAAAISHAATGTASHAITPLVVLAIGLTSYVLRTEPTRPLPVLGAEP